MKFIKNILFTFLFVFVASIFLVLIYTFINPQITLHMIQRTFEGNGLSKNWKYYEQVSPNFFRAVIAAEDARFFEHSGIDWHAVDEAKKYNAKHKGKKMRGASTITMQTAKNVFLVHSRTYLRKFLEVYFTFLMEVLWSKKRILEIYINIVETGPGIYGVEKAAQNYFNKSAANLSKREAALIAAVLPNPIRWSPAKPTAYISKKAATIQARMNAISLKEIERNK